VLIKKHVLAHLQKRVIYQAGLLESGLNLLSHALRAWLSVEPVEKAQRDIRREYSEPKLDAARMCAQATAHLIPPHIKSLVAD
jgi:hypothetical protein